VVELTRIDSNPLSPSRRNLSEVEIQRYLKKIAQEGEQGGQKKLTSRVELDST